MLENSIQKIAEMDNERASLMKNLADMTVASVLNSNRQLRPAMSTIDTQTYKLSNHPEIVNELNNI